MCGSPSHVNDPPGPQHQYVKPSKAAPEKMLLDGLHIRTYPCPVELEWDSRKAVSNLRKHGIDFADAAMALYDPLALTVPDDSPSEGRFVTIGMDALGRLIVVVYTWRGERVHLISARKAMRSERRQYEEKR